MPDYGTISGRIVDQNGEAPSMFILRILRKGKCRGRSGYVSEGSDQVINAAGNFTSHLLPPNDYILRFQGLLDRPWSAFANPSDRTFTFFYPAADEIVGARPFTLQSGHDIQDVEVRIPIQRRFFVRGFVSGAPDNLSRLSILAYDDDGIVDGRSASGVRLNSDATFSIELLPGNYLLAISVDESILYEHSIRVEDHDVNDVYLTIPA